MPNERRPLWILPGFRNATRWQSSPTTRACAQPPQRGVYGRHPAYDGCLERHVTSSKLVGCAPRGQCPREQRARPQLLHRVHGRDRRGDLAAVPPATAAVATATDPSEPVRLVLRRASTSELRHHALTGHAHFNDRRARELGNGCPKGRVQRGPVGIARDSVAR